MSVERIRTNYRLHIKYPIITIRVLIGICFTICEAVKVSRAGLKVAAISSLQIGRITYPLESQVL